MSISFDYLIIANTLSYKAIKDSALKMGFSSKEVKDEELALKSFEEANYNKVLFYNGYYSTENQLSRERFYWTQRRAKRVDVYSYNDYMRRWYYKEIDILKMLTGERSYNRIS